MGVRTGWADSTTPWDTVTSDGEMRGVSSTIWMMDTSCSRRPLPEGVLPRPLLAPSEVVLLSGGVASNTQAQSSEAVTTTGYDSGQHLDPLGGHRIQTNIHSSATLSHTDTNSCQGSRSHAHLHQLHCKGRSVKGCSSARAHLNKKHGRGKRETYEGNRSIVVRSRRKRICTKIKKGKQFRTGPAMHKC